MTWNVNRCSSPAVIVEQLTAKLQHQSIFCVQEFTGFQEFVDKSGDGHIVDKVCNGFRVVCEQGCPCAIFVPQCMYGLMSGFDRCNDVAASTPMGDVAIVSAYLPDSGKPLDMYFEAACAARLLSE